MVALLLVISWVHVTLVVVWCPKYMTYYLLHWLTNGLIEYLGSRQELFNFMQDRCGAAGESRYGGMQTSCTQWCAVCLLCICARATEESEQMVINRDLGHILTAGSSKCEYLKLVKRLCIDKSLCFQESCSAKTAHEAASTEIFLFLCSNITHTLQHVSAGLDSELTCQCKAEDAAKLLKRNSENKWEHFTHTDRMTEYTLEVLCENKTHRAFFFHSCKKPITPMPSQAWFLILHFSTWWI